VVGLGVADAVEIVCVTGLSPYGPDYAPCPDVGTVTEQAPAAGQRAVPNAPVVLTVQAGGIPADPGLAGVPVPG
jgi:beta-lactam-binding protein with PASTA domain